MKVLNNWNSILLKHSILDSEYFEEYAKLYSNTNMYYYEENRNFAFVILQINNTFNDSETPYGYGSFYTNNYSQKFLNNFFYQLKQTLNKNNIIVSLIRFNPLYKIPKNNTIDTQYIRKIVYMNNLKNYTQSISKKCLYSIRRGKKLDLNIYTTNNKYDYLEFYSIYKALMKNKNAQKELLFSKKYFEDLYESHIAHLIIAKNKNNNTIGGSIFIIKEKCVSYYHLSAFRENMPGLNNYILSLGIELAYSKQSNTMILGGGTSDNMNDSLLKFKLSFSKEMLDFFIGKFIVNEDKYFSLIKKCKNNKYKNYFLRYRYE